MQTYPWLCVFPSAMDVLKMGMWCLWFWWGWWQIGISSLGALGGAEFVQRGCFLGSWAGSRGPPSAAISGGRTWPGRPSRHRHRQQPAPTLGQPHVTRSVEDARYIHLNFRLLAEIYSFELVRFPSPFTITITRLLNCFLLFSSGSSVGNRRPPGCIQLA